MTALDEEKRAKVEALYKLFDQTPNLHLATTPGYTIADVLFVHNQDWELIGLIMDDSRNIAGLFLAIKELVPDPKHRETLYIKALTNK